jgi:hypothetical protein
MIETLNILYVLLLIGFITLILHDLYDKSNFKDRSENLFIGFLIIVFILFIQILLLINNLTFKSLLIFKDVITTLIIIWIGYKIYYRGNRK